jgi:D-alanyl-lipoteichoic acid acyltransferase DltB (MBOAT superfamily)
MMPQFSRPKRRAPIECLADGLPMFAIGLFKKTVLADSVAPTVNVLFGLGSSGHPVTLLPAWGAAFAYAVQIYFDFSGYSDMAIGLSRCLGIDLPINFNSPYKARSISDFWRRWHITLSRFLRDYLYIPLGGNRRGAARRYLNLLVTMLLGGIWHGAGWTFVLWGLLHGLYLAVANAMTSVLGRFRLRINPFLGSIGTLIAVLVAWIPFRAPNVATTLQIWKGMLGWNGVALPSDWAGVPSLARVLHLHTSQFGVDGSSTLTVAALFVACTFLPNSQEILREMQPGLDSPGYQASGNPPRYRIFVLQRNLFWAVAIGVSLALSLRTIGDYSAFIYFQF